MPLVFKNFEKYPGLVYGMSEIKDGSMRLAGDAEKDKAALKNREVYFSVQGIVRSTIVSASLVHGARVHAAAESDAGSVIAETDGLVTNASFTVLTITVADCFPVFFYHPISRVAGIAHAGWRGVKQGIIPAVVSAMRGYGADPDALLVGIGPGIGACHFEVKEDVMDAFAHFPRAIVRREGKIFVDLESVIREQLTWAGMPKENIASASACTFCLQETHFSFRRDGVLRTMIAHIGSEQSVPIP